MNNTTTLFVIGLKTSDKIIGDWAEAATENQTHLSLLIVGLAPMLPFYAYGYPPYSGVTIPENWGEMLEETHKAYNDRVGQIEALLAHHGTSGDVRAVKCTTVDIKHIVAQQARVSDVVHVADNLRDSPEIMREVGYGALFHSPVGLILNAAPTSSAKRIFVAWDSSATAARSLHVALPYMKNAKEVVIACFDATINDDVDPGTDVAAWLSHHGCNVTVSQYSSGGLEIGKCIQNRASELGADLIVMGAYGHARIFEAVFGGTTVSMMEQTKLPVLFAH